MNLFATIERFEEEGFTAEQIVIALKCLVMAEATPAASSDEIRAARKREADRARMAERRATVALQSRDTGEKKVPDKEIPHTPLEINLQENNYHPREAVSVAFDAWNNLAAECDLPKAQFLTTERERKIRSRLADCGGLDGWNAALAKIRGSPWCRGENDRGWRADLDFLLQRKSFTRLMEGTYDGRSPGRHETTRRAAASGNNRQTNRERLRAVIEEAERRENEASGDGIRDPDARAA